MSIHSRQGVIQDIDVRVLIGSSGQANPLLLTPAEIYTLKKKKISIKHSSIVLPLQGLLRRGKEEICLNKVARTLKSFKFLYINNFDSDKFLQAQLNVCPNYRFLLYDLLMIFISCPVGI